MDTGRAEPQRKRTRTTAKTVPADADSAPARKPDPRSWHAPQPPLPPWVLDFAVSAGFRRMTPVQAVTAAHFLGASHKDVVVEAVTGSGKTLAFLIPLVVRLLATEPRPRHHLGAVVVAPTRELAAQTHDVLLALLAFHPPSAAVLLATVAAAAAAAADPLPPRRPTTDPTADPVIVSQLLVGGAVASPADDLAAFLHDSPTVLVATPGRLAELLASPRVLCPQSSFEVLVLDEADRLLDLGFKPELQRILAALPKQRRTGLFSASVSEAVGELVRVGLRNPVRVAVRVRTPRTTTAAPPTTATTTTTITTVPPPSTTSTTERTHTDAAVTTKGNEQVEAQDATEERRTPAGLQICYLVTPASYKLPALARLLRQRQPRRAMIFVSTCAAVDYLQHVLPTVLPPAVTAVPLHGRHPPATRRRNFARFAAALTAGTLLLLTTDLASRGLDVPAVDLVVQLDPPTDPKAFIHRCGRTARAGRRGLAVVLLQPGAEEEYVDFLAVRGTPIMPLPSLNSSSSTIPEDDDAAAAAAATAAIRARVLGDRALHDKAQRAFVSWVRAYAAHHASALFRPAALDWADLARAWGLLRLPVMPELRAWPGDRALGLQIDWDAYAYRDATRERARRTSASSAAAAPAPAPAPQPAAGNRNAAWSDKTARGQERVERRERRHRRRDADRTAKMTQQDREQRQQLDGMIELVRHQNQQAVASSTQNGRLKSSVSRLEV